LGVSVNIEMLIQSTLELIYTFYSLWEFQEDVKEALNEAEKVIRTFYSLLGVSTLTSTSMRRLFSSLLRLSTPFWGVSKPKEFAELALKLCKALSTPFWEFPLRCHRCVLES
jgi:hypothetical protein